jgi:hypothetical protein
MHIPILLMRSFLYYSLFYDLREGTIPLFHLNFGTIILLLKKENAIQIQQYRPISLLNVSFKVFTKVGTNRILEVAHSVVRPTQTAFISRRHIFEGVVVLHKLYMSFIGKN